MKVIIIVFLTFTLSNAGFTQLIWERTYGGTNDEIGYNLKQLSWGGYILQGWSKSYSNGSADYYIVKIDEDGNTIFTKHFGYFDSESGLSVNETSNFGIILCGSSRSIGSGAGDFYLIKTDSSGNELWHKTYGGSSDDYCRSLVQTSDGNLVMAGYTTSYGSGGEDFYVVKTDSMGNFIWHTWFGGSGDDEAWNVIEDDYGDFIVSGWSKSYNYNNGNSDFLVIKISSSGTVLWNKVFGGIQNDYGMSVIESPGAGYFFIGTTYSFGAGSGDAWVLKLNENGDSIWSKTYGDTFDNYARAGVFMNDSLFVIAGYNKNSPTAYTQGAAMVVDTNGVLQDSKVFGGTQNEEFWDIDKVDSDNVLMLGTSDSPELIAGQRDYYVVKYFFKILATEMENSDVSHDIEIFPNPATDWIMMKNSDQNVTEIQILNACGTLVYKTTQIADAAISVKGFAPGLYFLVLNGNQSFKFIKE